jgi:hypothetical protein
MHIEKVRVLVWCNFTNYAFLVKCNELIYFRVRIFLLSMFHAFMHSHEQN